MDTLRKLRFGKKKAIGETLQEMFDKDPELRQDIIQWGQGLKFYDKNSPSQASKRRLARREFTEIMRKLHEVADDVSDEDVFKMYITSRKVVDHALEYLNTVARPGVLKGRLGEHVKIGSIRSRLEGLWHWAVWEAGDRLAQVFVQWERDISTAIHMASTMFEFETKSYEKPYFGGPELRLLFDKALSLTYYANWRKQMYVGWVLAYMTGLRPSSLALGGDYKDTEQCLLWRDIKFHRNIRGPGIFIELKANWLKGQRDPGHPNAARFKALTFLFKPCKEPENIHTDPTLLLLLLAIDRRLFGNQTIQSLWMSNEATLMHDTVVTNEPVFCALKGPNNPALNHKQPMLASAFNATLSRVAQEAGLAARATMYCFRREFITKAGRVLGKDAAKTLAGHVPEHGSSYEYYDYSFGDLDISAVVTGEADYISSRAREQNENRLELAAPAVRARGDALDLNERKLFVRSVMDENEQTQEWEDALSQVLVTIRQAFTFGEQLPLTIEAVRRALEARAGFVSAPKTWSQPTTMDYTDAGEWSARTQAACDAGPDVCLSFFKTFLLKRKNFRNFIIRHAQKAFKEQWKHSIEEQNLTVDDIRGRVDEAATIPRSLQDPAAFDGPSDAMEEDQTVSIPRWTGDDSNDAEAAEDDETRDDEEFAGHLLTAALEGQGILSVAHVGEDEDEDEAQTDTGRSSAPPTTAASDRDHRYYEEIRSRLIIAWDQCAEVPRGKTSCKSCQWRPEGTSGRTIEFPTANKVIRHMASKQHGPAEAMFAAWAYSERTLVRGSLEKSAEWDYECPFPTCQAYKAWNSLRTFKKHCQTKHADFLARLAQ